jgi:DNA polymerase III delta subunit
MLSEADIKEWWERKLKNYIQNYARRNGLTLAQARARFFTETHEKLLEALPQELKKFLDRAHEKTSRP